MRRVAITGLGIWSPIGNSLEQVHTSLIEGVSGIRQMPEWRETAGLRCHVAGLVDGVEPRTIPRKARRAMGRMALLGTLAAKDAVASAGLDEDLVRSRRCGVAMGSTTGSPAELEKFFGAYLSTGGIEQQEGTLFMKIMSHTVAANVAGFLGVEGRLMAPSSACASSAQAIGMGYETIQHGYQDIMICGGAEDVHPTTAGVFDVVHAASKNYNDSPAHTPRPFDKDRDGLVVSEGGAAIVLEAYEHARNRNAPILGEILGYATCCSSGHMTSPDVQEMLFCMQEALRDADMHAEDLDYINAHATATEVGDVVEAEAIRLLAGTTVPLSGTKGYTGHTLGACGAIEAIFCLLMMKHGFLAPTLNCDELDPRCAGLDHVRELRHETPHRVMTNSFAFGGVNAVLILGKL